MLQKYIMLIYWKHAGNANVYRKTILLKSWNSGVSSTK